MQQVSPDRVSYRYPLSRLLADYLRAGLGAIFCLFVLLAADPASLVVWIFGALTIIFLLFGLHTARLHITRIELDDLGISTSEINTRTLSWQQLEQMRLRYFGSKRQRRRGAGSVELTLWGSGRKMKFDGQVEGFRDIVWHALRAARERDLPLDEATVDNLLSLALDPDRIPPRPPPAERDLGVI